MVDEPRPPDSVLGDLFVLGAGFSRAAAPKMPLLADLPELLKSHRAWNVTHEALLERFDNNVETLLTYLSQTQPFLGEGENLRNRADFLDVSKRLGWAVAGRQDEAIQSSREPPWLSTLVQSWDASPRLKPTTVVTFNYDTLVEKTFETLPAYEGPDVPIDQRRPAPHAEHLYAVTLANLATRSGVGTYGGTARPTFALLKLHGSVNWLYSGSERFFGETIYHVPMSSGWNPDNLALFSLGYYRSSDKTPLIVPPTTEKSPFFANETVRWQWEYARNSLAFVKRVYFIGYSLPETDMLVRFLFSGLNRRVEVHLVNRVARRSEHERRSDERIRDDFIRHYKRAFPRNAIIDDYVRVDEEVMSDFAGAYVGEA